ncbi:MAG: preprotein translocase subunit SecG [Planctomycetota bacterium]|nr:preprotein translocase subunit SecG [Planctomycetota bacterium]
MTTTYLILTAIFIIVSVALILIILVQRPAGGGLAGAFGGAGGGGTESVFGGRVGDALTVMTVVGFCVYLGLAITLNLLESRNAVSAPPPNLEETLLPYSETDPFEIPADSGASTTAPDSGATTPATTTGDGSSDGGVFVPSSDYVPSESSTTPDGEGP